MLTGKFLDLKIMNYFAVVAFGIILAGGEAKAGPFDWFTSEPQGANQPTQQADREQPPKPQKPKAPVISRPQFEPVTVKPQPKPEAKPVKPVQPAPKPQAPRPQTENASRPAKSGFGSWDGEGRPRWNNDDDDDEDRPRPRPTPRPTATPRPTPIQAPGKLAEDDPNNKDKSRIEFDKQPRPNMPIRVTKTAWTPQDEVQFGKFINRMGKAIASRKCNSVKSCFKSPEANMYASEDPAGVIFYSDCADFPYLLRAYFAYHNGLPFSHVLVVKVIEQPVGSINDRDAQVPQSKTANSPYGNMVVKRGGSNVARAIGAEPNLINYLTNMFDAVSTSTLRVNPLSENYDNSDFYPVKIDKNGIVPGTIVHSTGHALIVWNVDPKGTVKVIDAHPDGSVQFKEVRPSTLDRSRPDQALGFFRFRPLTLVGASEGSNGNYIGGQIVPDSDEKLAQAGRHSMEQWFGPGSSLKPRMKINPKQWTTAFHKLDFFDFLSNRLRGSGVTVRADEMIEEMLNSFCEQINQRVADVDSALKDQIHMRQHPETIPGDIFGEEDAVTWGPYSTPGRDGRLRSAARDILRSSVNQFRLAKSGQGNGLVFEGSAEEYAQILRSRLAAANQRCSIKYQNSRGATVTLTLNQVLSRLNRISLDPYHCAEKRWGAVGKELESCRDGDTGNAWYNAEQYIRNTLGKTNENGVFVIRSDKPITLDLLKDTSLLDQPDSSPVSLGTKTPPVMNLDQNFASPKFIEMLTSGTR